jgi:protein-tyrosine phosphatase
VCSPDPPSVAGLVGLRDLGGLERRSGRPTPYGVFYRSAMVDNVTDEGWKSLHELGIRSVVDLRRPDEVARDRAVRPSWLTTIQVDLDGLENTAFWTDYVESGRYGTALYYLPHLDAMPERASMALSAIVTAPPAGVLFHCAGGRDRTGLVAMLLLSAAGATTDAMAADYMETVRRLDPLKAARPKISLEEICMRYGTTTEGAFRTAAEALDLDHLLEAGGFAPEERQALFTWRGSLKP